METDAVLVARVRAGDNEAFGDIYQRHYPRVYHYLYALVSNREDAEDLANDTFVVAMQDLARTYQEQQSLGAWLCTVARNVAAQIWRKRLQTHPLHRVPKQLPQLIIDELLLGVAETSDLARRQAQVLLARLAPRRRLILELIFLQALTLAEAAAAMSIQRDSAQRLLLRAVEEARQLGPEALETPVSPEAAPPPEPAAAGPPARAPPPTRPAQAQALAAQGLRPDEIAAHMGISVLYVYKLLSRARQAAARTAAPPGPEPAPGEDHPTGGTTDGR